MESTLKTTALGSGENVWGGDKDNISTAMESDRPKFKNRLHSMVGSAKQYPPHSFSPSSGTSCTEVLKGLDKTYQWKLLAQCLVHSRCSLSTSYYDFVGPFQERF